MASAARKSTALQRQGRTRCVPFRTLAKLIDAEQRATEAAMVGANRPNCTFTVEKVDEENLGAFLQLMEFETTFIGELLNINAFDQEGKKFTFGLMGRSGYEEY